MKNLFVKKLAFLFDQVAIGNIESQRALDNFLLEFGGKSLYIPEKKTLKKEIIIRAYDCGMNAKIIAHLHDVTINYVYSVISEINGERLTNNKI